MMAADRLDLLPGTALLRIEAAGGDGYDCVLAEGQYLTLVVRRRFRRGVYHVKVLQVAAFRDDSCA